MEDIGKEWGRFSYGSKLVRILETVANFAGPTQHSASSGLRYSPAQPPSLEPVVCPSHCAFFCSNFKCFTCVESHPAHIHFPSGSQVPIMRS